MRLSLKKGGIIYIFYADRNNSVEVGENEQNGTDRNNKVLEKNTCA